MDKPLSLPTLTGWQKGLKKTSVSHPAHPQPLGAWWPALAVLFHNPTCSPGRHLAV